ncbi:Glucose-induced degradation complex subunit [Lathyrus oleraceus]|uniref:Glucose-induced degradation complex subunit n=1 Tax=Pisum sativum TaxID=3888 RepID=A0A9D4YET0_PEA|nr:Glucose-induced degradation complex subunit [Pisum sativum]
MLKALFQVNYLYWLTVENAVSPLAAQSFPSIVSDGMDKKEKAYLRQLAEIEAMAASKKVIPKEEWGRKLNNVKIRKEDMNKLVMNFLVPEGFVEVAEKFCKEFGTEPDIDLATITGRMAVKKAVQSGNVEDAIEKVNDLNPEMLDAQATQNRVQNQGPCKHNKCNQTL